MLTESKSVQGANMNRKEYYSDRKMRFVFDVTSAQLLEAKAGEPDFDLEDHRFCYACKRWFNAAYFISEIEHNGQSDLVCEGCATKFSKLSDSDKAHFLGCSEREYLYWKDELKIARQEAAKSKHKPRHGDHEVGERPYECTACFAALAFRRY
jgi:hypothetical protein